MNVVAATVNFARLVGFETRRSWQLTLRYPLDAALGLGFMVVLFFGLSVGSKSMAVGQFAIGNGTEGLLVGFLCWTFAVGGVSHIAQDIEEEAKTGTLEPLFLSFPGPAHLFFARSTASLVVGLPVFLLLSGVLILATGTVLHISMSVMLPMLALDVAATGIGFLLGALALIVKRVRVALVLAQLGVVALMVAHFDDSAAQSMLPFLPLAPAVHAIRMTVLDGGFLGTGDVVALCLNAAFYQAVGVSVFMWSVRHARMRGLLAQH